MPYRPVRGALRIAYDRVSNLTIRDPRDEWDRGFNDAVARALKEIQQISDALASVRGKRRATLIARYGALHK